MDEIFLEEICHKVCEISRNVGKFMLEERRNFSKGKIEKKGSNDFVSYVDKKAEEIIVKQLQTLVPNAGFLTEEETVEQSEHSEYKWIIDPLDGTTNYIHGFSPYAVSIALVKDNQPIVGVVYIVPSDECFYAWQNSKAYLNEEEISGSPILSIEDSLVITGFPYKIEKKIESYLDIIRYFTFNSHGIRRVGSAAADLVYIACGRAEIFYQTDLKPWDVAAGAFIAERAGCCVTDFCGGNNFIFGDSVLATGNNKLNEEAINLLSKYFAK